MSDVNAQYNQLKVVSDDSGGLLSLKLLQRIGEKRKAKVGNNFIGLTEPADSLVMTRLAEMLAQKIGDYDADIIVVGMHKSGIVAAAYLAQARKSRFSWTTTDSIGATAIKYEESHRPDKAHYLYGVEPGSRVILVEDEVASGKGIAGFANKLQESDIEVTAIASFLETINFGGRQFIKQTTKHNLVSLATISLS